MFNELSLGLLWERGERIDGGEREPVEWGRYPLP